MASEQRLYRVTAVLARGPGLPGGDTEARLVIDVPLDGSGALAEGATGTVRRSWPDREEWLGELVPLDDGQWGLRGSGTGDDAPVWEMQARMMRPGEYLTLLRPNDAESAFRVVNVEPA